MRCLDARHVLAVLGFFGIFNVYLCRLNLSIAIVAMVRQEEKPETDSSSGEYCPGPNATLAEEGEGNGGETISVVGEFDWDPGVRGDLLGSYYYGYIWTQVQRH